MKASNNILKNYTKTIKDFKNLWLTEIQDSEIQRNLIWPEEFKKTLINSILKNNPIGALTLFKENERDYKEIIDGKQRIYAIESFWKGEISINGKYFKPHDFTKEEIETFWNFELNIQESHGTFEDKVELFDNINTKNVKLSQFELLRAKFYGPFINTLSSFVREERLIKEVLKTNDRGKNEIIILDILREKEDINIFLKNNKKSDFNFFIKKPKAIFLFITEVFKSYQNERILIELAKHYQKNKSELITNRDQVNEDINLMLKSNHIEKWDKLSQYERILDRYIIEKDKTRIFHKEIKEELWNKEKKCQLCLQSIDKIEDSEVDHKKPWIKGGETTMENAQLAHRYCNRKKGSK